MIFAIVLVPLVVGLVSALAPWRRWVSLLGVVSLAGVLVLAILLARESLRGPVLALKATLAVDPLSALLLLVIGAVGLLASIGGVRYLDAQLARGQCSPAQASLYAALVQGFIAAMILTVLARNIAIMWVAVEATTIVTTFLVGHRRTRGAIEASWKYIIICSVGIALAFLGTILLYVASSHSGGAASLDWSTLVREAPRMNHAVVRLAFSLIVLGYGTKVGLAPLHSWLPDAHSQAPAPVSALMSGVLLAVAFYALVRCRAIAMAALGGDFVRTTLLIAGLATLAVAVSMLLAQRDYKRMLAYSSMEHMGLLCLGAAAGTPLAFSAVLLHMVGHGLAKSVLFLGAGEILEVEGTSEIAGVSALLARRPALGALFGLGLAALLGLPPFSLFASELGLVRALSGAGLTWVAVVALAMLALVMVGMSGPAASMLFGPASTREKSPLLFSVPLGAALGVLALVGVVAWPLSVLVHAGAVVAAL
jgi:hydrogenase-4 component F